jgi:hypothetical protein
VGLVLGHQAQRIGPTGPLRHDGDVICGVQDCPHASANDGMVIYDNNANHWHPSLLLIQKDSLHHHAWLSFFLAYICV